MSKLHKDLLTPETHNPKGFAEAPASTVLSKDHLGNLEYVSKNNVGGSQGVQGVQGPVAVTQNLLRVQKAPQTGEFLTIEAALANITIPSATNQWVVKVGPGIYLENQLILKSFVSIIGDSENSVTISPINVNIPLFVAAPDALLSRLTISEVTNSSAINVDISSSTFFVKETRFINNKIHVDLLPTVGVRTKIDLFRCVLKGFSDKAISAISTATIKAKLVIHECNIESSNPIGFGVFASGSLTEVILNGGEIDGELLGGIGVQLEDGASIESYGTEIEAWDKGLVIANVGAGPKITLNSILFEKNVTKDVEILHPLTDGLLNGSMNSGKMTINSGSNVSIVHADHLDNSFTISGDLKIGKKHAEIVEVSDLISQAATMGVLTGGLVTSLGGLNFTISAGYGYIDNLITKATYKVVWGVQNFTVLLNQSTYITMDLNGLVILSNVAPSTAHTLIFSKIVTDNVGVIFVDDLLFSAHHGGNDVDMMLKDALGPVYESGSIVSENAITPFQIDITGGVSHYSSSKSIQTGGLSVTFKEFRQSGGAFINVASQLINNTQWDNNGVLSSIPLGLFTKHSLYVVNSVYMLVLSQATYGNLVTAEGASIPTPPSYFNESVALIATIIVQEGAANIIKIIDERPVIGFKASGVSATANHGNLLNRGAADAHLQYLNRDGSQPMTGALDLGGQDIINAGIIPGTTTAAPVTINPDVVNTLGISTAKAKADHIHNIPTAIATSISGTNVKGVAASFARSDHKHKVIFNQIIGNELTNQLEHNLTNSVGVLSGFSFIDNLDGTIGVNTGELFIKSANLATGDILYYKSILLASLILTNLSTNYIYVQYNAGVPIIIASALVLVDTNTNVLLGSVYKNALDLHIDVTNRVTVSNHASLAALRLAKTTDSKAVLENNGGAVIGTNIIAPNSLTISAGTWWKGLNRFTTPLFDSSLIASSFDTYYMGPPVVAPIIQTWVKGIAPVSVIDILNYRDPITGTLLPLTAPIAPVPPGGGFPPLPPIVAPIVPYYSPRWIYMETSGRVSVIYGGGYESIINAESEQVPQTLPPELKDAILVGQIVVSTTAILPAITVFKIRQKPEIISGVYISSTRPIIYANAPLIATAIPELSFIPAKGTYDVTFNIRMNSDTGRVFTSFAFNTTTVLAPLILVPIDGASVDVAPQRAGYAITGTINRRITFNGLDSFKISGFYNDLNGRGPGTEWSEFYSLSMVKL